MPNSVTLTLPLPPRELSPNARVHWRKKAAITARCRENAYWETLSFESTEWEHLYKTATMQATFYWPTKHRRDVLNAESSLKAYIDGIVDSGMIPDDDHLHLTHLPTVFEYDKTSPRVEITITERTTDGD